MSSKLHERLQTSLSGAYAVGRELGQGGTATVYLAEDLKHHRQVAIKLLLPELAESLGADRFLREIQIAAQLRHPHIVPLYDSGARDGLLYFVMPFLPGESLRGRLIREGRLPVADALRIGAEVADALAHAHAHNVIHRDIKPENILLESRHALVADFGIARPMIMDDAGPAARARLTEAGFALGTHPYMSPEQMTADPTLDGRADIYALGCVLYEMLVGEVPFTGATRAAVLVQQATQAVPRASERRPEVPALVTEVVAKTMCPSRTDRFATAAELADVLDAVSSRIAAVHPSAESVPSAAPPR